MSRVRYSRWDGSQQPFGPLAPPHALGDAFNDALLAGDSAQDALARLLREGLPGRFGGLQGLESRLRRLRAERRRAGHLDEVLEELTAELEEVVSTERDELAGREDADARFAEAALAALPPDPAGKVAALRRHDFASADAARRFADLLDRLRRELLSGHVDRIAAAMRDFDDHDVAALKEMLADLNALLEQRRQGAGPTQEEFGRFMERHGHFFPDRPGSLDDLLDGMAQRSVAMSRLLASLPDERRAELEALSAQLLDDLGLEFELERLSANLRSLLPEAGWDRPAPMEGRQPLGLGAALDEIQQLSEFEELEACMRQDYPGARLEDIDLDMVRRLLGEDAAGDVAQLQEIERALAAEGVLARRQGRLTLTPRGIRKLGERALATVFERLELAAPGSHDTAAPGTAGEPTGSTRPWRFGDPFRIDLNRTVMNAVTRTGPTAGRVLLRPDDFELAEAEARTATATVLLLDMSRSMPLRGHWTHARHMAFALHALIEGAYPEDRLAIVGFSDYARELAPADLAAVDWEPVYGTNMEHAFRLAGRILARERADTSQVLLVTDGEPTAHLVGERVFFNWPPVPETLERTYREALRLAAAGVTMNIFMLERSPGLVRFIDRLARLVRGRVFTLRDEELGAFAVRDYVAGRTGL